MMMIDFLLIMSAKYNELLRIPNVGVRVGKPAVLLLLVGMSITTISF